MNKERRLTKHFFFNRLGLGDLEQQAKHLGVDHNFGHFVPIS